MEAAAENDYFLQPYRYFKVTEGDSAAVDDDADVATNLFMTSTSYAFLGIEGHSHQAMVADAFIAYEALRDTLSESGHKCVETATPTVPAQAEPSTSLGGEESSDVVAYVAEPEEYEDDDGDYGEENYYDGDDELYQNEDEFYEAVQEKDALADKDLQANLREFKHLSGSSPLNNRCRTAKLTAKQATIFTKGAAFVAKSDMTLYES